MENNLKKITVGTLLGLTALVIFLQWFISHKYNEIIVYENGTNEIYHFDRENGFLMPQMRDKSALQIIRQTKNTITVKVGITEKTYVQDEFGVYVLLSSRQDIEFDRKKVAILYISTGRYILFWENFYNAMERHFLPNHDKTYFLFTDHDFLPVKRNVIKIHQDQLKWPFVTLKRFHFFDKIANQLKNYDYIYFLNGTMLPVSDINEEIFPSEKQEFMVTIHPGYFRASPQKFPYDRNPKSKAYIMKGEGRYYVMGGFNGGTSAGFLKLIKTLKKWTDEDLENDVIPLWHDESMLNRYLATTMIEGGSPLILLPEYAIPEQGKKGAGGYSHLKEFLDYTKMYILEKTNYGGHSFLRGQSDVSIDKKEKQKNE